MEDCEHKFIFLRNQSFYRAASRYSWEYVSIDTFFCEKCMFHKENKMDVTLGDHELHKLPDWAQTITTKIRGYE